MHKKKEGTRRRVPKKRTVIGQELTWRTVDAADPQQAAALLQKQSGKADARIKAAVKKLQDKGIIDVLQNRTKILERSSCRYCQDLSELEAWLNTEATV